MSLPGPIELVLRLGIAPRIGAIGMVEQAVDAYLAGYAHPGERAIALDILLRDLARLRIHEPDLDPFIGEVEQYIDQLHRNLARQAA
ncbi:hypothetical protein PQI07_05170 [Methylobacterium sp. 092160098-2]|jgi:hypothetical protein|uniref:Protein of unassigned function n=1 Tax=Methylobacterium oryzae CBMB20 TaxID=693986 RepID=A0A089P7D1_9HYPH|nr:MULTISPECIES: hypothetical protein [Methylobacterium]KOX58869.1 hypothetical protein ADL19_06170 [Streptomyces purpurogeneiscleroticus]AIQ93883.1 protein of unassigned function [Methylobacterium oryzae CBMB20]AWV14575.1 hypothetical protein A3862_02950 [Methylobacterium sp. XJLW]MBP29662.1 hypothetical protein [Methylobacterium sp.]MDE4910088.1 hypothetical protein [Methylobacterium sp. 092160098-2]